MLRILVLGSSYGMLVAARALLAGHHVTAVGRPDEVACIERAGIRVEIPMPTGGPALILDSRRLPGKLVACAPESADPWSHDLVVLAMQEPQLRDGAIRRLMGRIGLSGRPCLSVMNMPAPPYLTRIPALSSAGLTDCYSVPEAWTGISPDLLTQCSPDPQAARPAGGPCNVLRVGLATNFRAAIFPSAAATVLLRAFAAGVNDARLEHGGRRVAPPVRLRVHESPFVPLSKWSMLLTGNYRSIRDGGARSIRAAVHDDLDESRRVYDLVNAVLRALGAGEGDLIGFDQYAGAALHLVNPSSAARALSSGATEIERVDRLVLAVARHLGFDTSPIEPVVGLVDRRLAANRVRA